MVPFGKIVEAGRRLAGEFVRCESGGPASEFALTAPIIIALIFATAQVAIIYIANAYLETVAEDAARDVMTNQTTTMSAAQFQTQLCSYITTLFTCGNVMISLAPATSTTSISTATPAFNSDGTLKNTLAYTQPASGQIAVLQVLYQWPVLGLPLGVTFGNLGNGDYLMVSTQVFMVEPQT